MLISSFKLELHHLYFPLFERQDFKDPLRGVEREEKKGGKRPPYPPRMSAVVRTYAQVNTKLYSPYIWNPPIRERGQGGVFSAKDPPEKARKKRREEDMDNMRHGVGKRGVLFRRCNLIPTCCFYCVTRCYQSG